jgi:hypothetical protein
VDHNNVNTRCALQVGANIQLASSSAGFGVFAMTDFPEQGSGSPSPDPEIYVAEDLSLLDVSGADGRDGRDGLSFAGRQAPQGRDGQRGGDATLPDAGEHGGDIELVLQSRRGGEGFVEISGRLAFPNGAERPVRQSLAIGEMGYIRLLARGGRGGRGGHGGDGEAGGRGHDGADATRWSSGQDGGPGGDGGDGGSGTSGASGGDGGRIVARVDQLNTHLLMLLQHETVPGDGGAAGTNGNGGAGGPGGSGGRSHHWTTTSTEYHRDHDGKMRPRTVTHHHSNPGGSSGPRGRSGDVGRGMLRPGRDGNPGQYRILVDVDGRSVQFLTRYEVEIVDYDLHLQDHFAEPTSEIRVSRLRVKNSGGMPTPINHPVQVHLGDTRWVDPIPHFLRVPRSLQPGEQYTFEDEQLVAAIPEIDFVPTGEPLQEIERINPLAKQSGVNRYFKNRHPRKDFVVAFPGEIQLLRSLESQVPGSAALFHMELVNRSQFDLGRQSSDGRVLRVHLGLQNSELSDHLMLLDMVGQQTSWDTGYDYEIDLLPAGQSVTVKTIVGILPGAPGYRKAELATTLMIGERRSPEEARARHRQLFPIRIAQAYEFNPDADILLIANHGTTTEEKAAWEQLAARLGQTINIWDISLNDSLTLSERLQHGTNLLRDFHGKTIILSNGPFDTSKGIRFGDQFVSQMDLIKAAESHNIRIMVLNDLQHEIEHLFQERLIPTDGEPEFRYSSIRAFEKKKPDDDVEVLFDQVKELIEHGSKAAQPDPIRQTSEIAIWGIRSPNAKRLQRQAADLQAQLEHATPGRRVVVMYRMPEDMDRKDVDDEGSHGGIFFSHDLQGALTVMPTVGDSHPNLVLLDASPQQIHDPAFITGSAVKSALIQSLNFEEKVFLLSAQLRELGEDARIDPNSNDDDRIEVARALVDAILVDLTTELATAVKTPWKSLFFNRKLRESLAQLHFLVEHPFALTSRDGNLPDVQLAARLIAGVEFLGRTASRWYESRLFPWGFFRRGPVARREILDCRDKLQKNLFGSTGEAQQKLIDQELERLYSRLSDVRKQQKLDKKSAARSVLRDPLSSHSIRSDAEQAIPSVLSFPQWNQVRELETGREDQRLELQSIKEKNRADFLVAYGGRPLESQSAEVQAALKPFTEAVVRAHTARESRPRRTAPHRVLPTSTQTSVASTDEDHLDDHIEPMQELQ